MNIRFLQDNKIPLVLALDVDGTRVYYEHKIDDSFVFMVDCATEEKAMDSNYSFDRDIAFDSQRL